MQTIPATPDLVPFLLARMAPDERGVIEAHGGEALLAENVATSVLTWCGIDDAGPVNMGGVWPLPDGAGYVWQLVTPDMARHKRAYLLQGRAMIATGLRRFPRLVTVIALHAGPARRHATRMGWTLAGPCTGLCEPALWYERLR